MYFDPTYFLFIMLPSMILGGITAAWVKSTVSSNHEVAASKGLTGAQVAQQILDANGVTDVRVEQGSGWLSDHYSPAEKVVRLSPEIYNNRSVSAMAIAAHEVGHAIQHHTGYAPLVLRSAAVPLATWGPQLAMVFIMGGAFLQIMGLAYVGLALFSCAFIFAVITLPVEFDASWRALGQIERLQLAHGEEYTRARRVLTAAAMTYVAAAIVALIQFLYYAHLVLGRRR